MTRIENAQKRLDVALARLEQASAARAAGLERDLAATRDHCASLENRNRDVAARLDAAIARIHALLNEGAG